MSRKSEQLKEKALAHLKAYPFKDDFDEVRLTPEEMERIAARIAEPRHKSIFHAIAERMLEGDTIDEVTGNNSNNSVLQDEVLMANMATYFGCSYGFFDILNGENDNRKRWGRTK